MDSPRLHAYFTSVSGLRTGRPVAVENEAHAVQISNATNMAGFVLRESAGYEHETGAGRKFFEPDTRFTSIFKFWSKDDMAGLRKAQLREIEDYPAPIGFKVSRCRTTGLSALGLKRDIERFAELPDTQYFVRHSFGEAGVPRELIRLPSSGLEITGSELLIPIDTAADKDAKVYNLDGDLLWAYEA